MTDVDARLVRAQVLVHGRRAAEAVPLLEEYVAEHPDDALGWRRLTDALGDTRNRDDDRVLAAARRAIELDPSDPGPHRHLAEVFLATGRFGELKRHATRAVQLAPDDPVALSLLALARVYADHDRTAAWALLERTRALGRNGDPGVIAHVVTVSIQRAVARTVIVRWFGAALGLSAVLAGGWAWFRPPGGAGVAWMLVPGVTLGVAATTAMLATHAWPRFELTTDGVLGAIVVATVLGGFCTWIGDQGSITDAAPASAATAVLGLLFSARLLIGLRGR